MEQEDAHEFEYPQDGIDVPPAIGCESFGSSAHLGRHPKLELVVGDFEERQELSNQDPDILLVDEGVGQFECSSTDRDVAIAETVEDDGSVTLDGVRVHSNDLVQRVERDIAVGEASQFTADGLSQIDSGQERTGYCCRGCPKISREY